LRALLVNGSPREKRSASAAILDALGGRLERGGAGVLRGAAGDGEAAMLEAAQGCAAIVFAFPLYVDGVPSGLLRLMEGISGGISRAAPGAHVYAVANNGFYEGRQNAPALETMKLFCAAAGLAWGQGLGVGGGPMLRSAPIGRGPAKALGGALDALALNILEGGSSDDVFLDPGIPRFLYRRMGEMGFRARARRNGLGARRLYARPYGDP
jgi:hypothetical protein